MALERLTLAHHPLLSTTGLWEALIVTINSEDTTALLSSAGNATSTSSGFSSMLLLQMHSFYAKSSLILGDTDSEELQSGIG